MVNSFIIQNMSVTRLTRPLIESVAKTVKPYGDIVELDFQRNNIDLLENLQPLSLTELIILNLSYNRLQTLQNLVPIATLKELKVSANCLVNVNTALPFPRLQVLDLSENKIYQITAELPESLLELDLRSNLICTFESIAPVFKLRNLVVLDLRQNPIVDKYISNEAFYTYVTKFLPKLDVLNGEPISSIRQPSASQMQLSKTESRLDKSGIVYDLTESRVTGVASATSQASYFDNQSGVQNSGQTKQQRSLSTHVSSAKQQDPGINIKIYSNYYDKGGVESQKEQISDSQRMVNEHLILFRSPSNRRLSYNQSNVSNPLGRTSRSISHERIASSDNTTAMQQSDINQDVYYKYVPSTDNRGINRVYEASGTQRNGQDAAPITVQRSRSFRAVGGSIIQEMQVSNPSFVPHTLPNVHNETQSLHPHSKSISIPEQHESIPRRDPLIDTNISNIHVEEPNMSIITKLRQKCMEQEIEIHRLNLELKAASEILSDNKVIPGLLSRDTAFTMGGNLREAGKIFVPTISGPNEYAKLLSQTELSELALLKAQVHSLEESISTLENESIVTYPHPEVEKPGQHPIHIALYSYRRKLFHTILASVRQKKASEHKINELQNTILTLTKHVKEKEELELEADAKHRLQEVQLKDSELRRGVKQKTIETLTTELSQYRNMFKILSDLHTVDDNGLVSYIQHNSVSTIAEMVERALDLVLKKILNADQSIQAVTTILGRQKLRIEALTDQLDDYEHKYSSLLSEHEDLLARYDALKDNYKNLQLEKIKLETDSLDNGARRKPPCANFAVQVRPRIDTSIELTKQYSTLEDSHTNVPNTRTSITDIQTLQELPPSPSIYINPGSLTKRPETSPKVPSSGSQVSTISAAAVASQITKSIMQNSRQLTRNVAGSPTRYSTQAQKEPSFESIAPAIELQNDNKTQSNLSEDGLLDMRIAERKQLAAEMKELQNMTVPRSSSSNRKRAEKIMGMLSKLDSLM